MKTVTIYTNFAISSIRFGVHQAVCKIDKPNISHSEDVGYALNITIPDGATLETNNYGDVLLYQAGEILPYILFYNDIANRVEGGWGGSSTPIKGLHIIEKIEI